MQQHDDFGEWFNRYLHAFGVARAGEAEFGALLDFYALPLLVTTPDAVISVTEHRDLAATIHAQVDPLAAQGYSHTAVESLHATVLNAMSTLLAVTMQRRTTTGELLQRLHITYLVTGGPQTRRISVMAVVD